jgi:oligopeptide transport system permease protein
VLKYTLKRLLHLLPVFIGATFLIFAMVFALPGDPIRALAGQNPLPESVVAAMRVKYNLDEPLFTQYFLYMANLFQGDLGTDFNDRSVSSLIAASWPSTFQLGITAWLIEIFVGIPLGLWMGLRRGKVDDVIGRVLTVLVISVPVFVIGFSLQMLIGVQLGWLPVSSARLGWPLSYILPGLVLAVYGLASIARLLRSSIAENLQSDFVKAAKAKGLTRSRVVRVHIVRNSLIPVVTLLGIDLAALMGGAILIEGIFNLPGMGNQIFAAIGAHNGPVIVGISTMLIVIFLIGNLVVDLVYAALDPRIRRV